MRLAGCEVLLLAAVTHLNAEAVRFDVDYAKSAIAVRTDKAGLLSAFAGHRHGIVATEFTAGVCADPQMLEEARIAVRVPVSSLRIDTPEARRIAGLPASGPAAKDVPVIQQKMLSPANLDAAGHPEIRFESSSMVRGAEGLIVRGPLTIRGEATQASVPLRIEQAGGDYRITGRFDIKLKDYGITPESIAGVVKVADHVTVLLDLLARPGKEPCK
ncbi:MAG TPA: YceI family protein [Bryobacteraceae bacterium]|nr:YceI family protein [Bryobacteraceae bacterium]